MIHLFEPVRRRWLRTAGALGELWHKQVQGVPLQQSDIPPEKSLQASFEMPDFGKPSDGFRYVSQAFRAALEELAPGCVVFFPMTLKVPPRMRPANPYFFFDVLPRANLIDWDQSLTTRRVVPAPNGGESRALKAGIADPSVRFRPVTPDTPPIWREADVERPSVHFFHAKMDIFMRDDVWEALNGRFPKQLEARKLA